MEDTPNNNNKKENDGTIVTLFLNTTRFQLQHFVTAAMKLLKNKNRSKHFVVAKILDFYGFQRLRQPMIEETFISREIEIRETEKNWHILDLDTHSLPSMRKTKKPIENERR